MSSLFFANKRKIIIALVTFSFALGASVQAQSSEADAEHLRNAQMFMKLIGIQPSQEQDTQKILLKSMKKRVKAYKNLRRVNGRPGQAFEELKKIQRRERNGLKSILSPSQLSLYDKQIKKNKAAFFGNSSKGVPGVSGGQDGGYSNENKTDN